jgi:UDP-N-acetylglucosamine acyltransferase
LSGGSTIDPRAVIHDGARIGEDVSIGPYCVIGADVTIGDRCRLESHVVVEGPTTLGPDNWVAPMASLGGPPQDRKYGGERTSLQIGQGNRIREFVTINRGTDGGGGLTTVGGENLFMAYAHIAHDCHVGDRTVFANAATLAGHVEVGDDATVGAFSAVHQFCRVARHAFVGGGSIVTRDVLPWVLTVGNRAKSAGLNIVGLKRAGYPVETIRALKRCYALLFRSKVLLDEAMRQVEEELGHVEEVRYFLDFVRTSERGVCR